MARSTVNDAFAILDSSAGVAQLVRARGSYPRSPGFKSLHRHHCLGPEGVDALLRVRPDVHAAHADACRASARPTHDLSCRPRAGDHSTPGAVSRTARASSSPSPAASDSVALAHAAGGAVRRRRPAPRRPRAFRTTACAAPNPTRDAELLRDLAGETRRAPSTSSPVTSRAMAQRRGRSLEEAAREARYAFLERVAQRAQGRRRRRRAHSRRPGGDGAAAAVAWRRHPRPRRRFTRARSARHPAAHRSRAAPS